MMKLFDGNETDLAHISKLEVDEEFERRYNYNKDREYLQRYGAAVREGQIRSTPEEEEDEEEEDTEINKLNKKEDIKLFDNLNKLRRRDPIVYQPVHLFDSESDSDSDDDNEVEGESKDMKKKSQRPQYLKDVVAKHLLEEAKHLLEEGPEFEDVEPSKIKKKSYFEEQEELKKAFLEEVKNSGVDDDGGDLLKEKKKEDENEGDSDDGELQKKLGEFFGPDDGLDENSKFLKDFFEKQMWIDKENKVEGDEGNVSDEDEEVWVQEDHERQWNFRHEENAGDIVLGHSRIVEGSVRKEKNPRKDQRESKKERKKAADMEKQEELKHLKNLKKKEIREKLMKVKEVGDVDVEFNWDDLDEDFDPEEHDEKMNKIFNDEYYNKNDADPKFGSDDDEDIEKPDFDKEDEKLGLPKGWNAVENDDGFLAARKKALEKIPENDDHEEEEEEEEEDEDEEEEEGTDSTDTEDSNDDQNKEEDEERGSAAAKDEEIIQKRKRKEKISLLQRAKEAMLEEYYKLDYEGTIGDLKTRFKYAKVKPNRFGLKTEEVLMLDDKELNQYVSVKKIAPYREMEWKVPDSKRKEYKEKVKELRRSKWKNHGKFSKKNPSRDNGDKRKSASDQERKPELEETDMEVANLSSRKKRKLRQKEYKLSDSRRVAYGIDQVKKRKH